MSRETLYRCDFCQTWLDKPPGVYFRVVGSELKKLPEPDPAFAQLHYHAFCHAELERRDRATQTSEYLVKPEKIRCE
jgi:hypothetical protein